MSEKLKFFRLRHLGILFLFMLGGLVWYGRLTMIYDRSAYNVGFESYVVYTYFASVAYAAVGGIIMLLFYLFDRRTWSYLLIYLFFLFVFANQDLNFWFLERETWCYCWD